MSDTSIYLKTAFQNQAERTIRELDKWMKEINYALLMIGYYHSEQHRKYLKKKFPNADHERLISLSIAEIFPNLERAVEEFNTNVIDLQYICYDPETNTLVKKTDI